MQKKHGDSELMYVKCAYCGNWMDVKPGRMNRISHSICPACFDKAMPKDRKREKEVKSG